MVVGGLKLYRSDLFADAQFNLPLNYNIRVVICSNLCTESVE